MRTLPLHVLTGFWLLLLAGSCSGANADFDRDRDVDLDDFGTFQRCISGQAMPQTDPACRSSDLDGDGDVDGQDLDSFLGCLSGAGRPGGLGCASLVDIPARPAGAIGGQAFVNQVQSLSLSAREARIREELLGGNCPPFLRGFLPVSVTATIGGAAHTVVYEVSPDYLGIGSDSDWIRMPMTPATAQQVADAYDCLLPTRKMVNDIYAAASVKLAPWPISPATTDITAVATFYAHHQHVEEQRAAFPQAALIGGIKKDVVISPQLASKPGKVAIYGWHQLNGVPIQPLYLGHVNTWVDYSQCIRMVAGTLRLDGQLRRTAEILADPQLCVLLSDEGVLPNPRY